ncbi:MAG: hypothetical protein M3N93_08230 [Acidobacteriota bacterium]|nr:hypothetical protein [Acidobacteriota bacterium]
MLILFIAALLSICFGALGLRFFFKIRILQSSRAVSPTALDSHRYQPMLRLLSDADLTFLPAGTELRASLRRRRRELFRGYLRCLTRDYAQLLAGLRLAMVNSGIDRPDLARALAKNKMLFALALCKIEFRLAMHATGIGNVDISGLVEALEVLRGQAQALSSLSSLSSAPLPAGL